MQLGGYRPVSALLVDHVCLEIMEGNLTAGAALPSITAMALATQINPSIVEQAYTELTEIGAVVAQDIGWHVTAAAATILRERERERFLNHDFPTIRRRIKLLGIKPQSLDWEDHDR